MYYAIIYLAACDAMQSMMRDCVMVARLTLDQFVRVQILVPQPYWHDSRVNRTEFAAALFIIRIRIYGVTTCRN